MSLLYARALVLLLLIYLCRGNSNQNSGSPIAPMSLLSAEDSGSIEMPVRKQRSGQSQHRPIVELVLGVLDTFHSSAKSELNRIKARRARQNEAYYEVALAMTSTTEAPRMHLAKLATPRKRLFAARI